LVSFDGIPRNGDSWSDRAIQGDDLGELVAYSDAEIAAFVHEQGETAVLESTRTATTKKKTPPRMTMSTTEIFFLHVVDATNRRSFSQR
jgi:hypothetical protein